MFCGFCERYGCEHYAKSSPQTVLLAALLADPRFEVRTECQVLRINVSADGKTATDVTYVDAAGRDASGTVGRNDAYQTMGAVQVFYDQDRHSIPSCARAPAAR
nr:hypothetical protein [Variovorax boronicumulans]